MAAKAKTKEQAAVEDVAPEGAVDVFNTQEGVTQAEEFELPVGYEHVSVGFRRAFEYAKGKGNPDKSSLLFAEAHAYSFEPSDEADYA